MHRAASILLLSVLASHAPFQCSSEPDPAKALEETPGEALYQLAGEFRSAGDEPAWASTLRYLIEHYPSSRFATMAKLDLDQAGLRPPSAAPSGDDDP